MNAMSDYPRRPQAGNAQQARFSAADLPTLSQLRALQTAQEPEPEADGNDNCISTAGRTPDLPTASQLKALREEPAPGRKNAPSAIRISLRREPEKTAPQRDGKLNAADLPTLSQLTALRELEIREERERQERERLERERRERERLERERLERERRERERLERERLERERRERERLERERLERERLERERLERERLERERRERERLERERLERERRERERLERERLERERLERERLERERLERERKERERKERAAKVRSARPAPVRVKRAAEDTRTDVKLSGDRLPTVDQLRSLLETEKTGAAAKQTPAASRPVPAAETKTEPVKKTGRFTAEDLPSLSQLESFRDDERQFGNVTFQENVRSAKGTLSPTQTFRLPPEAFSAYFDEHAKEAVPAEPLPPEEQVKRDPEQELKTEKNKPKKKRGLFGGKKKKKKAGKKAEPQNEDFSDDISIEELPTQQQLRRRQEKTAGSAKIDPADKPSDVQLRRERARQRYLHSFLTVLRNTIYTLVTVSAVAVLIAVLLLPVLRIYGSSMTPTLEESDVVLSVKGGQFETGDVIAFYYNNKILVKRVIAQAGDWVDIDRDTGDVSINGKVIDEPYVKNKAFGECDIKLPYQVPEDRVFVMGDHRDVSIDSRNTTIGCIAEEQIVGRIIYRIWPFSGLGKVE